MQFDNPLRYRLSFDAARCSCVSESGAVKFSGIATNSKPKLYVICVEGWPVYVGITKQSMSTRLRLGFSAKGKGGYHGYAWRHRHKTAELDIWCQIDGSEMRDVETVEAEVVFLIRQAGNWPEFQTEIHFHQSNAEHRRIAERMFAHYRRERS